MTQAQAARQTSKEEPAANVRPEEPTQGADVEEADLEAVDLEDEEIGRKTVEILSRVRRRIREQPLTAASGAFILGFAIGNGVPKFLARAGIAVGLRIVMQRMFGGTELFEDA